MEHSPEPAVDTTVPTPEQFARPASGDTPNDSGQNHDHWVTQLTSVQDTLFYSYA
jgi:hypothetical protein